MDRLGSSLFIGGKWVPSRTDKHFDIVCASTEEVVGTAPEATPEDVDAAVLAARSAVDDPDGWAHWDSSKRAATLEQFADVMQQRGDELGRLVTLQNGMPTTIANLSEVVAPPKLLRYYATLARSVRLEEERVSMSGGTTVVRRVPVGVVAAIVPWNFPQSVTFFKLAPALAAGNSCVLKPAPETVLDAWLIADAAAEAGIPPGVINLVTGGPAVGAYLVQHPDVDKVAFTGSTRAGRSIGEVCGRLLRPVTLELGGKSATVILDDADLASTVQGLFPCTLVNSGQTCMLGTRVLAPRSRYDEVVDALTAFASALPMGDPFDLHTMLGPLVSSRQRDRVERYIALGRKEGRLVLGGGRPPDLDKGWYVSATIFSDVSNDATIAREEIFGPVLTVIPYDNEEDAIRIANDSRYGLGGSVWSADPERARAVASRIRTGTIGVNFYDIDYCSPFGGIKDSGIGRELGPEGLAAFQQLQSVYLS
ncbi:aldehyde dehydrogenase [Mycobacterium branderi]|uniref:Aldehyde dehydrogenase n=1 Tax=Mycobacterium branderi TaxID=43348 RepID=A0A7I7WGG2_9MYCO|nr:aldehyde dehydrogenase [Mycobacterium branderi]MCV7231727.1 aldehyde dehydrogenase [Mycobacterium branderi]ORA40303.1 aldehyde dehydrogenase [Mycobacterium branderi]BBZ15621.1 aldehyde dehydrogenase [Mycobacterium branderi]